MSAVAPLAPAEAYHWVLRAARLLALSLVPLACGLGWGVPERHVLAPEQIRPDAGEGFVAPVQPSRLLPLLAAEGDSPGRPGHSASRVLEDGVALGPAHTEHEGIRANGRGRFSHWGERLYFSSSDRTDPRANRRRYVVETAATLPMAVAWAWAACVLLASQPRLRWPFRGPALPRAVVAPMAIVGGVAFAFVAGSAWGLEWPGTDPAFEQAAWSVALVASGVLAVRGGRALSRPGLAAAGRVLVDLFAAGAARLVRALEQANAPFEAPGPRGTLLRIVALAVAPTLFAAALLVEVPSSALADSYYRTLPVLTWAGLPLVLLLYRRSWLGGVAALTVAAVLFALPLRALWQDLAGHPSVVGGLLPASDAGGYYADALRLLSGEPLGWSSRRPLFVGLLSTLLAATGRNLQLSIALMVLLNAVAAFLLAREWRASFGPIAGATALVLLFLFYRVDGGLGTTLTENLGLAMGALGFAAIARGVRTGDPRGYCVGLGLLTLALMARAGAFFVLPALVAAAVWEFRHHPARLRIGAGALASVLVASLLSLALVKVLARPTNEQQAFSNFSYVIYGLVVGGKGWNQVAVDHPEAREGGEIYALAWQAFQARPMGLIEGGARALEEYLGLTDSRYHAFAFVRDGLRTPAFQDACYALAAVGLIACGVRFRKPMSGVLLFGTAGHLLSIPFLPPGDAGLRVYAATMPLVVMLTAAGVAAPFVALRALVWHLASGAAAAPEATVPSAAPGPVAQRLGLGLTAVVMLGPIGLMWAGRVPTPPLPACPAGERALLVDISDGAYLAITADSSTTAAATRVHRRDLRPTFGYFLDSDTARLRPGTVLTATVDLATGQAVWLVLPPGTEPGQTGRFVACGSFSTGRADREPFFRAASLSPVGGARR